MTIADRSVIILDRFGKIDPLYTSWAAQLSSPCVYVEEYDADWEPPLECGVLVTAKHFSEPEISIVSRAVSKGISTLILADGILEYRNTWQHPDIAAGSIYQPVIGHKIACLGRSQGRVLESWGNLGKCEIVGLPRLDSLIGKQPCLRQRRSPFRILIMTAKMPGFTPAQMALAKRAVQDLKFWFSQHQSLAGTLIEPVWRLTKGLADEIGVENHFSEPLSQELAELLHTVDAAVTTPSTAMLESMVFGLPVALLDYNNSPHYVPAAWTITAPRHFDQVMPELINPPAAKMLYQDTVLHDALECRTPATPRMIKLIEEMVCIAGEDRSKSQPLCFPMRILGDEQDGHHLPEECFDLKLLYPEHPVFGEMDRTLLQTKNEQLNQQVRYLNKEVKTLQNIIKADNFLKELGRSFPGPRKLLRLWRERREKTSQ